jgi:PilZ domain
MVNTERNQRATVALERRAEPRFKTSQPVLFRTEHRHFFEACILDISTTGAQLRASEPVPVGVAVRVDAHEMVLFGTVTRCELTRGAYNIGILLSRPLKMLGELSKLNESLSAEEHPD